MNKTDTTNVSQETKQRWPKKEIILGSLSIVITLGLVAALIYYKDELMGIASVANYGLLGLFIIAFLGSGLPSMTAVPVPFWLLVLTLPSVLASRWGILAPVWIALITALGISLGQLLTFMVSYGGRSLSQKLATKFNNRFYNRAMGWAQRHGSWAVFVMSAIFNPIHLPMTIAIAALRYPPQKFFFFCFLGALVKSLFIAFSGYFGLGSIIGF